MNIVISLKDYEWFFTQGLCYFLEGITFLIEAEVDFLELAGR